MGTWHMGQEQTRGTVAGAVICCVWAMPPGVVHGGAHEPSNTRRWSEHETRRRGEDVSSQTCSICDVLVYC